MNNLDLTTAYGAMSDFTAEMLTAARAEDWESLALLESHRFAQMQTLKEQENQQHALPIQDREQIIEFIQKILENDLDLRKLTSARMAQLSSLMDSAKTERKLSDAYA